MPREIVRRAAWVAWALCAVAASHAAGCSTAGKAQAPNATRAQYVVSNDKVSATIFDGFGEWSTVSPSQTPMERFLFGPQESSTRALRTPQGVASEGDALWVCDQGYPDVFRIDLESGHVRSVTARAHRPASPIAIARSDSGDIFVADATRRSVLAYGHDGVLQFELVTNESDQPFEPTALLVHNQKLFIADRAHRRIACYDLAARSWVAPLAPPPQHVGLAVPAGLAMTRDGVLLITDAMLGLVHRVDASGEWLAPMSRRGRGAGEMVRPIGICCTPEGLIAVADAARQAVLIFDGEGTHLIDLSGGQNEWGGWTLPMGVGCLAGGRQIAGLSTEAPATENWLVVTDMLGKSGLTFISLRPEPLRTAMGQTIR